MTNANQTILEVKGLAKHFPLGNPLFAKRRSYLKAVDAVDFQIKRGEILGLVGESGCGKTTVAKCILRLLEPTAGTICLEGKNILELGKGKLKPIIPYRLPLILGNADQERNANDISGPSRFARSQNENRLHNCRALTDSSDGRQRRDKTEGCGASGVGRFKSHAHGQIPPRVRWRATPAHRPCARPLTQT